MSSIKKIEKPWGYELLFAHTAFYVGKILHINPGGMLSLQYHENKDETIFVIEGEMWLEIGNRHKRKRFCLKEGEGYHIAPKQVHRFTAPSGCTLVEVSTPHLDDVIRLEDIYGRA